MTDVVDSGTRSRMMSGIRGKNTKPELLIRSQLHRKGYRFRTHVAGLPGKPDIVLKRHHAIILVHGCFWHGHNCPLFKWPATRAEFWKAKIRQNRRNDNKTMTALRDAGWRICIVWECSVKGASRNIPAITGRIDRWLKGKRKFMEIGG
ncbi:MAG: DNA mismatch endonuclease Vsr [Gammaproteobacteria bacterium]|nr:DNA mismatch endonuclease Vsr [Gammaproteobacteria bacterium]